MTRTSTFVGTTPYADNPTLAHRQSMMSLGADQRRSHTPYADFPSAGQRGSAVNLRTMSGTPPTLAVPGLGSANRLSVASTSLLQASPSRLGLHADLSTGSFNGLAGPGGAGPDDGAIIEAIQAVLADVDLDTVTKKQVRALVEQRLQTELAGERRTFMDRQIDNELANM